MIKYWYPHANSKRSGRKVEKPADLRLTVHVLCVWYIGDGTLNSCAQMGFCCPALSKAQVKQFVTECSQLFNENFIVDKTHKIWIEQQTNAFGHETETHALASLRVLKLLDAEVMNFGTTIEQIGYYIRFDANLQS